MEILFQYTHQFEKDLKKITTTDRERVNKQVSRMAELFSNDRDTFFKHARRAQIILRNGLEASLYVIPSGPKLRILLTIDDDPIFDQRIFTLLRVSKHDEYAKVFSQLAESMYQQYLVEYSSEDIN